MDDKVKVMAILAPDMSFKSLRQDLLSQKARDILACAFAAGVGMEIMPGVEVLISAVEVKIGEEDWKNILTGGDSVLKHAGAIGRYLKHADDEGWAVVVPWDCDGDPAAGAVIIAEEFDHVRRLDG